jgi:adenylyltransferase/sulfurtransferase
MNLERYRRQILVEKLGEKGQNTLFKKHVVIIGGGGLGSTSANILVRAGIGSIDIIDNDAVDVTNLHRTSIFSEEDIGKCKSLVLEKKLQKINSNVVIKGINRKITQKNIETTISHSDIVLDGTDNMEARFLINEAAIKNKIPWIYAGVHSTTGMVMGIIPRKTPCLTCISHNFSDKRIGEIPVFANLPLTIASIQCTETVKFLLENKVSGLIIYDIWKQHFEHLDIKRNPTCPCCANNQFKFL